LKMTNKETGGYASYSYVVP